MKFFFTTMMILLLDPLFCFAGTDAIPHIANGNTPDNGIQTLKLNELWRVGGEDEDIIFGRIVDIKRGAEGNIYVLDNQLCQVMVFSSSGEHQRNLSREGDGPGELRQPVELAFISDDILGIGMGFPGKLISLQLDGTPDDTFYPIGVPSEGNIGLLMGVQIQEGMIVACGGRMVFGNNGQGHTDRFISLCNNDCTETQHILEKATPLDLTGGPYVEATAHYIERTWALGEGKFIYAADERDNYKISVFNQEGTLVKTFGRQYNSRKRTKADKENVRPVINVNNNPNLEIQAEDYDECISRILFNHDQGTVWALSSHGHHDQAEGILETWDVFTAEGKFAKQVAIPLGNEMKNGTIHLVGNNLLVVVKGANSALSEDEEEEVEPLEVICYEIK